jgi:hypothetical protein
MPGHVLDHSRRKLQSREVPRDREAGNTNGIDTVQVALAHGRQLLLVQTSGECRPELSSFQSNSAEFDPAEINREKVRLFDPLVWNRWACQIFIHIATLGVPPRPFS